MILVSLILIAGMFMMSLCRNLMNVVLLAIVLGLHMRLVMMLKRYDRPFKFALGIL